MPKALGEFGRNRNSDITNKVIGVINASSDAGRAITVNEIWAHISNDLESVKHLLDIIQGLVRAEKIQALPDLGFLSKREPLIPASMLASNGMVDFRKYLTEEELNVSI